MSNNKQTDIAELAIREYPFSNSERNAFIAGYNKAKEMQENECFEVFKAGQESMEEGGKSYDQYYNETYGGNNE